MMPLDCLFIGSSTKDIIMRVDEPPSSDRRISANAFTVSHGGVSCTAGAAHKRLGGRTGILSAVGDDEISAEIQHDLDKLELEYLKLYAMSGIKSSTTMIQVENDGKRCLTCFDGCINQLSFDMLDKEILHNTRYIHLGIMRPETMLEICVYCREHTDAIISVDSGNMPKAVMDLILPYTDLFIADHKTAWNILKMNPPEACHYFASHGTRLCGVTAAEDGAYILTDGIEHHVPTISVDVVDTTGAGDNFHGALIYCLNRNWSVVDAIRFANIFASLSCEGLGGRDHIPTLARVMTYFERRV